MKKFLFTFLSATVTFILESMAGNILTVNDVDIPQGGQATLEIGCEFDTEYTAFEVEISLPEGVSLLADAEDGNPIVEKGFTSDHALSGKLLSNGNYIFTCYSMTRASLPTNGVLMRVMVKAGETTVIGSEVTGNIVSAEFTRTSDSEGDMLAGVDFSMSIVELRTLLDETSSTMPSATTDVNVRLNRTFKVNTWSTLVLPFNATAEQIKAAWGDDVEVAEFKSWSSEEDGDGAIVGIDVVFNTKTDGIEANMPVIIRTTADYTTATFDNVTLEPENEPYVRVGSKAAERGWFYGTYIKKMVPEENVFLSKNKFWYSTGATEIMGYRGYFEFRDVMDAYYDAADVKFQFIVDGVETGIEPMHNEQCIMHNDEAVYDLSGRRVSVPSAKGVYVINGKKILK